VPNTFTPDADEHNQLFTPVFTSGFSPDNFEMTIFNRWGELVWQSFDHTEGWDGSFGLKGLNAPVVLCCASGNRSGQAHYFLSQQGLDCHNGGSWLDVNYYQSK
jgi:gliding motility-associated-like protein